MKTYSGIYKVKNKDKYRGDAENVVYRSSWEKSVMKWCDGNDQIAEWSSEEIVVPYRSDLDGRPHRYFVDFYIRYKTGQRVLIEVKPAGQTTPPTGKRRTKKYISEATTYVTNRNKWEAAEKYAKKHGMEFQIWTEKTLRSMGILPKTPKPLKRLAPFKRKKK